MKKTKRYFIAFLPSDADITVGCWVKLDDKAPSKVREKTKVEFLKRLGYKVVKPYVCDKEIKNGDTVEIHFTHGLAGEVTKGVLSNFDPENGPYCHIDGKSVDLAGEGHSSNMYKIVGKVSAGVYSLREGVKLSESDIRICYYVNVKYSTRAHGGEEKLRFKYHPSAEIIQDTLDEYCHTHFLEQASSDDVVHVDCVELKCTCCEFYR